MAQGTLTASDQFGQQIGAEGHNLVSDTIRVMLVSDTVAAAAAFDDSSDFTEVSGSGYTAGGITLAGVTYIESAGVSTLASTTNPAWTKTVGGPTDIRTGVAYNVTHAGTADLLGYIDMTVDAGTTPVSLVAGNVSITWHGSGMLTIGK